MSFPRARRTLRRLALAALVGIGVAASAMAQEVTAERPYLAEIKTAMDRMMAGMDAVPAGDVDRDFVTMMTPHHRGAIEMAVAELRFGSNSQLKRIAQEIIVDQQQEIAAMKIALGDPPPASEPAPTGPGAGDAPPPSPHASGDHPSSLEKPR